MSGVASPTDGLSRGACGNTKPSRKYAGPTLRGMRAAGQDQSFWPPSPCLSPPPPFKRRLCCMLTEEALLLVLSEQQLRHNRSIRVRRSLSEVVGTLESIPLCRIREQVCQAGWVDGGVFSAEQDLQCFDQPEAPTADNRPHKVEKGWNHNQEHNLTPAGHSFNSTPALLGIKLLLHRSKVSLTNTVTQDAIKSLASCVLGAEILQGDLFTDT